MDCPQCDTALTTYALQGREALVCERCGYVGIEADHHGTPHSAESWNDALSRFYDESGVDSDPHVPVRPTVESGDDAESDTRSETPPSPRTVSGGRTAVRPLDGAGSDGEGNERRTDVDGVAVDDDVGS
jgi:DNA-directed RNA polymerase subunit M/transcription elongation factor TFIIS